MHFIKNNLKAAILASIGIHFVFFIFLKLNFEAISDDFFLTTSIQVIDNEIKSEEALVIPSKTMNFKTRPISKTTAETLKINTAKNNQEISPESQLDQNEISNQSQISSPAKLISVVRAQRTAEAKKANYVADAKVLIIVNQQGVVDSAKLLNSLEYGLNEVALDIAKKLKFRPARIGQNAVRTQIELTINFKTSN